MNYDYSKPYIALTQLGFRRHSEKSVALFPGDCPDEMPEEISFYVQHVGDRLQRDIELPDKWNRDIFRYPIGIGKGKILYPLRNEKSRRQAPLFSGVLKKSETRWGTIWMGDFSELMEPDVYQIETEYGFSLPFAIDDRIYQRLERGYLEFLYSQRSGMEIPGVRPAENADDAVLDTDPGCYLPLAGGWNDAGDHRKWLFLTLGNIEALAQIAEKGHPAFRKRAKREMEYGNLYFHNMINEKGMVYEDVGGGPRRDGSSDVNWWNENHAGVTAAGEPLTDSSPLSGDERTVRSAYNSLVQYQFVRYQAAAARVLDPPHQSNCLVLAKKAWLYGQKNPHDLRTIFIAEQILAAAELTAAFRFLHKERFKGSEQERELADCLDLLIHALLDRQECGIPELNGYFYEKDRTDGYRSIAFPCEPVLALLRCIELDLPCSKDLIAETGNAVKRYIDNYLLKDCGSNPFSLPPYGVYINPPFPDKQLFRYAGKDRYVRTFIHLLCDDPIPHGVNAGFLQQAYLLARAGRFFNRKDWINIACRILDWSLGFNTTGLCLFNDIGFKHPVPASFVNLKIPYAPSVGFLGTLEDEPYLETSHAVEWSTQEIWDVPFYNTIGLITFLDEGEKK